MRYQTKLSFLVPLTAGPLMQDAVELFTKTELLIAFLKVSAEHVLALLHPLIVTCWSLTKAPTFKTLLLSRVNSRTMLDDGVKGRRLEDKRASWLRDWAIKESASSLVQNMIYLGCSEPAVPSRVFGFFLVSWLSSWTMWVELGESDPNHWSTWSLRCSLKSLVERPLMPVSREAKDWVWLSLMAEQVSYALSTDTFFSTSSLRSMLSV